MAPNWKRRTAMIQDARVIAADRLKKRMRPKQVEQAIVRYMSDYFHEDIAPGLCCRAPRRALPR